MSRKEEILNMGREIILHCKKSETVSYDPGSTSVEMCVDKILPLFQNLLKNWDKECRSKKCDNPLTEQGVTLDLLYKWVECEMRGYRVTEKITKGDIMEIVKRFASSRKMDGIIIPFPIEVLEISINQGDRYLTITKEHQLQSTAMRKILSEVYTTIVFYVNEIVSEIDIEQLQEGYGMGFNQYRNLDVDERVEPEVKDNTGVQGIDMEEHKKFLIRQFGGQ